VVLTSQSQHNRIGKDNADASPRWRRLSGNKNAKRLNESGGSKNGTGVTGDTIAAAF